jgi:hypothetical protein
MLDRKLIENLEYNSSDSRYKKYKKYFDNTGRFFYNELPSIISIPTTEKDSYYNVGVKSLNRLDLIAHMFYKNSKLWWVIAEANNIIDPYDIPVGVTLTIPDTSSLYGFGGVLG